MYVVKVEIFYKDGLRSICINHREMEGTAILEDKPVEKWFCPITGRASWKGQTGHLLFYFPEGRHCPSSDRLPANAVRSRCQRRFYRRTRLQFYRRNRLLCHNAAHGLPQTGRLRRTSLNARFRSPLFLFSNQFMKCCLLYTDTEQFHRLFQFFHCRVCRRNP